MQQVSAEFGVRTNSRQLSVSFVLYFLLSLLLLLLNRINFLKYKKPEKDLSNLNRSEVFKLIHNTDDQRPSGIALRPAKVLAVDDFSHIGCP